MSSATLYRASGLALLLGALLGIIGNILSTALFPGNDPRQYLTTLWVVVSLVSLIGPLLLLLGLPGIARASGPACWLAGVHRLYPDVYRRLSLHEFLSRRFARLSLARSGCS